MKLNSLFTENCLDENTILLTVRVSGTEEKASAKFTRTAESLQLIAYDATILNRFANYKEIFISE